MLYTQDEKPIIALCTPQGSGAIGVIRLSGMGIIELIDKMSKLSSGKKLSTLPTHTIHHGYVIDNSYEKIDEVLFFLMKAPKTFTGQDTIEISCHNNPFIINQIIQQAITLGAHHAQRGEFTKRSFLNNKIDLLQAEAINDLICAPTELALKKSMAQLQGTLSTKVHQIEQDLLSLLTMAEASFEFLDEEQRDLDFDTTILKKLRDLITKTDNILKNFSQQQHIKQGIRIAILGSVNVGKSTLFNALVQKDRAIVTNIPGTTRDSVETNIYKNGNFWLLIDTAGLRKTNDSIELKGIERTWQEALQSDIILLVYDATKQLSPEEDTLYKKIQEQHSNKIIIVANKIDLAKEQISQKAIAICAKEKKGIASLENAIEEKTKLLFQAHDAPFLLNQRQQNNILELNISLKSIEQKATNRIEYEIIAHHLKEILENVAQLTGKTVNEQVMNKVFNTFCIGK